MARSARQPRKAPKRRASAWQAGAVAIGSMISDNPVLVGGSTAFLVTLFYVSANALWYQPYPHKGAFFATRTIEHFVDATADEPETTINIERPAPTPAPVKPDPTVQKVQGVLKDLGFYSGTVDGISGPATQKAVDAYRHKVGLAGGAAIDAALLDQLGATPTTGAVVPVPSPREPTGDKPKPVPPLDAPSLDARIVKIQAGLKAFGNDDIKLDGVIGARTKSAIKEFQALFGLPETGEPDAVVYAKMREIGLTD
jgi:peptidoglycan hydrolase-like protein with peptidoglycan-binding domain